MATAEGVIPITRLRQAIGIVGDGQDSILISYRNTAITIVEKYIGRHILDVDDYQSEPEDFYYDSPSGRIVFMVADIKSGDNNDFVLHYNNADAERMAKTSQNRTFNVATSDNVGQIGRGRDGIFIYPDANTNWVSVMRMDEPTPYIVCNVGLTGDVPTAWGDAVSVMVRAFLDGSAYDEVSKMSILGVMLSPWKIGAGMATIR